MPKLKGVFTYNDRLHWASNCVAAIKCFQEIAGAPRLSTTDKFGPRMWNTLHTVLSQYPIEPSKEEVRLCAQLFYELKINIPCKTCRQHFEENLNNKKVTPYPIVEIAAAGNHAINVYSWVLHNHVNKSIGKPLFKWSQYVEKYQPLVKEMDVRVRDHYQKRNLL